MSDDFSQAIDAANRKTAEQSFRQLLDPKLQGFRTSDVDAWMDAIDAHFSGRTDDPAIAKAMGLWDAAMDAACERNDVFKSLRSGGRGFGMTKVDSGVDCLTGEAVAGDVLVGGAHNDLYAKAGAEQWTVFTILALDTKTIFKAMEAPGPIPGMPSTPPARATWMDLARRMAITMSLLRGAEPA